MKVKRVKHVRRTLLFYKNYFGVTPPYDILVDGTFCKAALKFKVNISEQLPKYLDAEVRIKTTRCVIAECEMFGEMLYGPLKILRQFPVKDCGHNTPQPPVSCLKRMVRGKKCAEKFVIATQDPVLSEKIRKSAGVPLIYMSHNAINLEAPSPTEREISEGRLKSQLLPSRTEKENLASLKEKILGISAEAVVAKKRRRKIKGPNPLSCKKSKKRKTDKKVNEGTISVADTSEVTENKKKSRHHRKKAKKLIENLV